MRRTNLLITLLILAVTGMAQITPQQQRLRPMSQTDSVVNWLSDLAMKNPQISSLENQAVSADYTYRRTRSAWVDNIFVAANLNEFSINRKSLTNDNQLQNTQYPRWNVGVRVPIGVLFNNGKEAKAMMYKKESVIDDAESLRNAIKRQVKTLYEDYTMNKELIALQQEIITDTKFLTNKTEEKFQKGEATLEQYTNSNRLYNVERLKVVSMERDLAVAKAQLEELIGLELEYAIAEARKALQSYINSPR